MKKYLVILAAMLGICMLTLSIGNAVPFPTPPSITVGTTTLDFGKDLDDSGVFSHSSNVVSFELFDLGDIVPPDLIGSVFGFYFAGTDVTDMNNLHAIFTLYDGPSSLSSPQKALVNFTFNTVFDLDSGATRTFAGSGENIGFFLLPVYGSNLPFLFTEASLNPTGIDVSGTYPITGINGTDQFDDDFLISFSIPGITPLSAHITTGIKPIPVPEPATAALIGTSLIGLAMLRRRLQK